MCGIVGYIGHWDAFPILIKGLYRHEYRGYDSAGVALINGKVDIDIHKGHCKMSELEKYCISPIVDSIPLRLAYHIAVSNGKDVDMPGNLAKYVTAE